MAGGEQFQVSSAKFNFKFQVSSGVPLTDQNETMITNLSSI